MVDETILYAVQRTEVEQGAMPAPGPAPAALPTGAAPFLLRYVRRR